MILHHDALRLRLAKENNDYWMFIEPSDDKVFKITDLSPFSDTAQDEVVDAFLKLIAEKDLEDDRNF